MSADQDPQQDSPQPASGRGPAGPRHEVDIVALVAGVVFILFSFVSLTVGILDLPDIGATPLWVFLIGAGCLLLVSEVRGRKDPDSATPPTSPEQAAWEQDTYR